jgi:hypothetical protein
VVRGPVDGCFLVWWVIDNIVWTDSWLSIAGAGCGLTGVGTGEKQARKVVAGEASMYGEDNVTPVFPKKTKCITICMPGSSFMHIVTYKWITVQYHVRKRKIIRN